LRRGHGWAERADKQKDAEQGFHKV
jgi:hypothetical protein